jgi:hypothetical protein
LARTFGTPEHNRDIGAPGYPADIGWKFHLTPPRDGVADARPNERAAERREHKTREKEPCRDAIVNEAHAFLASQEKTGARTKAFDPMLDKQTLHRSDNLTDSP